ncbi:MAG: hypothetical protein ACM3JJ_12125 [Hyphomicrobiales bacterium]
MATRSVSREEIAVRSFRADDLAGLLQSQPAPCITITLPTHRRHPEWKQDPVRFRAQIAEAEALLRSGPVRNGAELIAPLRKLLDEPFWEYALDGLIVFVSGAHRAAYRIPMPVPDRVVVADRFHTKSLFRLLHLDRRYYVLALSQNQVALYEGTRSGAGPVDLGGVPRSLREALGVPDFDRSISTTGGRAAGSVFHGRGPGREETKDSLARYFRAIDRGLREHLRDETAPLLLAAVKYYHPIYREGNTYPHLLPEGIEGNFERESPERIHEAAWPIVDRTFAERVAEWAGRFRALVGTGRAVDRLEDVAAAAVHGRVRGVLAAEGETLWGLLDPATGAVTRHERQMGPDDGDLLGDVCEEAYKRGADVLVVPREAMPSDSPIAAILRF